MARSGIRIGKVSEQTGLSVDAIRFYEKQHLLERPPRTGGGFRLFSREDIERIQFIRRAQQLGFSLPEIREVLLLQEAGEVCSQIRDLLKAKIEIIRGKIRELTVLEQQLREKLRKCEHSLALSVESRGTICPVLEEMAHQDSNEN
jgi:DNA-binding transcriptional MerR regulator